MAIEAILLDRRMLVKIRASFFRVAFITEFVDRIGFQHFVGKLPVRVMAVNACYFVFPDRMVGLLASHGLYVLVALKADFGSARFQEILRSCMRRMAIVAGNTLDVVLALTPERGSLCFIMAGKAFCGFGLRVDVLVKSKYFNASTAAFFHVFSTGTMAGLASIRASRPLHMLLCMNRLCIRCILSFVTALTGLSADIPFFYPNRLLAAPGQGNRGQQKEKGNKKRN